MRVSWDTNPTGLREVRVVHVRAGGGVASTPVSRVAAAPQEQTTQAGWIAFLMSAGERIRVEARHRAGVPLDVTGGDVAVEWLGPRP